MANVVSLDRAIPLADFIFGGSTIGAAGVETSMDLASFCGRGPGLHFSPAALSTGLRVVFTPLPSSSP